LFIENKALYARKGDMPEVLAPIPFGQARIARPGKDVTVVTYGAALFQAEAAAQQAAAQGIDVEIIDLRSLQPWDEAGVLASLARTHRLVIFHEAVEAFGVGAEIAARMADVGFDELDAPIIRVGAPFMPTPYSPELEKAYMPDAGRLLAAIQRAML
jgi:pyruvate dehydrogenase E1 component beta subunit